MKKENNKMTLFFTKKNMTGKVAFLMCLILSFSLLLTGCGKTEVDTVDNTVVMTIQDTDVTMTDTYLFLMQYLLNNHTDPATLSDKAAQQAILDQVVAELQLETVEYLVTQSTGTVVSDNTLDNAASTADNYYSHCGGDEFFQTYGIEYDDVCQLFQKQAYLNQLQSDSLKDLSAEYTTQLEEQYKDTKLHKVYYAVFPTVSYDDEGNPVVVEDGSYEKLSEEELANASVRAAEFAKRAKDGEAMEDLVTEYGIELNSESDYYYEGSGEQAIDDAIKALGDQEVSDIIETSVGYMIVRMDKYDDTDYKNYIIKFAANQQASSSFPNMQEYWKNAANLSSVEVNTTAVYAIDVQKLAQDMVNRGAYTLN